MAGRCLTSEYILVLSFYGQERFFSGPREALDIPIRLSDIQGIGLLLPKNVELVENSIYLVVNRVRNIDWRGRHPPSVKQPPFHQYTGEEFEAVSRFCE